MVSRRVTGQTVIALLIVVVGLILLGRSTGYYDASWAFDFVPSLFVLAGVYALVVSGFRNVTGSLLVIAVAGAWQLVTLDVVDAGDIVDLWPLLIVFFGLSILFGQYRARSHARETADDHPTALALFGGSEGRSTSKSFRGADLTAVFGGVEYDLRETELDDTGPRQRHGGLRGCRNLLPTGVERPDRRPPAVRWRQRRSTQRRRGTRGRRPRGDWYGPVRRRERLVKG